MAISGDGARGLRALLAHGSRRGRLVRSVPAEARRLPRCRASGRASPNSREAGPDGAGGGRRRRGHDRDRCARGGPKQHVDEMVRLWPSVEPGTFEGAWTAQTSGEYAMSASTGSLRADAIVEVDDHTTSLATVDPDGLRLFAIASGGAMHTPDRVGDRVSALEERFPARQVSTQRHPMRSPWWHYVPSRWPCASVDEDMSSQALTPRSTTISPICATSVVSPQTRSRATREISPHSVRLPRSRDERWTPCSGATSRPSQDV